MKKVLFIDRDGTIIVEPPDKQVDSLEKLEFVPGVIVALHRIAAESDYELVMVTNQDGLGTASFPEEDFWPAHNKMMRLLENEGVRFAAVHIDSSLPEDKAPTRKPGTAMLKDYLNGDYDLAHSFVIGDRDSDVQLAKNLGAQAIYFGKDKHKDVVLSTDDWQEIYTFLRRQQRAAEIRRTTRETDVLVQIALEGGGRAAISTGIGFLDHMLELFASHSGCNLTIEAAGDLHVDEHHTTEDVALALGEAIRRALGDKRGIERYGFFLPMDESVCQLAVDFSGRPELVWQAEFKREKIGAMPTEMFKHFFKSFAVAAGCNLYIRAEGENEHHKIEAVFKALGRSVKMAVRKDPFSNRVPSSKGKL